MPPPHQPFGPLRLREDQPRCWVRFHSATWVRITAAVTRESRRKPPRGRDGGRCAKHVRAPSPCVLAYVKLAILDIRLLISSTIRTSFNPPRYSTRRMPVNDSGMG